MTDFDTLFAGQRLMAILRGHSPEASVELAEKAWDVGISAVEVPIQTDDAVTSLRAVVAAGRRRNKLVGAGTVITREQLAAAVAAGVAFTVAPGLDLELVQAAHAHGLAHLPGIATATELQRAALAGLGWVKVFPASVLGADWFTIMRGPFPAMNFVATGGMSAGNAAEYLRAGVSVVAVGSALSDPVQLTKLAELMKVFTASSAPSDRSAHP
ncbi:MAG TPA: bifunctional 4-hydroxy-2-oxoglutarate aldolase/2-dehydro-3-deoxy-phosphogluconate aldolase [Jatrophihabitans sp.]|nr:bifunctional 4-hydroxy-2-oxoglutarate aldolase/2-dehydro-3-deoxy-phosphogluconate aldolase [Jatrophihabitans sp.]